MKDLNVEIKYNNTHINFKGIENDHILNVIKRSSKPYEIILLEYIKNNYQSGTAIDIGAHIGTHSIFYGKFCFNKIFAYEANPINYSYLKDNIINNKLDNIIYAYNYAISDSVFPYTSILYEGNSGMSYIKKIKESDLLTKTIDSFEYDNLKFIKIDVERHELQVLKGAKSTILKHMPDIVIECLNDEEFDKINKLLLAWGYKMIKQFGKKYINLMCLYIPK